MNGLSFVNAIVVRTLCLTVFTAAVRSNEFGYAN
jgi:hypothetical protein